MKRSLLFLLIVFCSICTAQDLWMDVDTAVTVPVNRVPLTTDGTTADTGVVYNEAGLAMFWNFLTTAGVYTQTQFDPCDTAGDYDWTNVGGGMYKIEIPASGGADMNNDTEGTGWVTGSSTANYIWSGPLIGFRSANLNSAYVDGAQTSIANVFNDVDTTATVQAAVTGGAYALDTDANGRVRVVDGTGAGEIDTDTGTVLLRSATETQIDNIETDTAAQDTAGEWTTLMGNGSGLTEAGGTGDQFTGIPGFATLPEEVWEDPNATTASATAIAEAVWEDPNAITSTALPKEHEISTVTSQTVFVLATGSTANNNHVGGWVAILDDSDSDNTASFHEVAAYVGGSKTLTIKGTPLFTVGADDSILFLAEPPHVVWRKLVNGQ